MNRVIVTLYTKPGCHLCEAAEQVIASAAKRRRFDLVVKSILDNVGDMKRFGDSIPVTMVADREVARHRISEAVLLAAIDSVSA